MVKVYPYGSKAILSDHFSADEFACKCGGSHTTLIDEDLITNLEKLFVKLECSKIIVNSGYRCPTHDKRVGGNGCGNHTKGLAADIVCYDKCNEIISSKKVCCAAQDVGFKGIANIDKTYTATHVDTRTNGQWYGDETITTTVSITDDFHKLYDDVETETKHVKLVIDGVEYEGDLKATK